MRGGDWGGRSGYAKQGNFELTIMDSDFEQRPVRKCICFNVPFSVLKESGLKSLEQIKGQFGCTSGCGMCAKYIELMLETGETEFPILWGAEFAAWRASRKKGK